MKEEDLIELGFDKVTVREEIIKGDMIFPSFYYYAYEFKEKGSPLDLISPANDEIENDNWTVVVYDAGIVEFSSKEDVKTYIDVINKNIIRK